MRSKRLAWIILTLALVWVFGWTLLRFIEPRAFPWAGLPIGLILFGLILVMKRFPYAGLVRDCGTR